MSTSSLSRSLQALSSTNSDYTADEALFGLSEGVSLADGGSHASTLPSKITIFQRPIEEAVDNREDLDEEVLRTVWHEVGHFLGFDEDEVADMGLG